jgi:hypothetical protein
VIAVDVRVAFPDEADGFLDSRSAFGETYDQGGVGRLIKRSTLTINSITINLQPVGARAFGSMLLRD